MNGQGQSPGKENWCWPRELIYLLTCGRLCRPKARRRKPCWRALAGNSTLAKPVQQILAGQNSAKVRARLAANEAIDIDILRQLLSDAVAKARTALLRD